MSIKICLPRCRHIHLYDGIWLNLDFQNTISNMDKLRYQNPSFRLIEISLRTAILGTSDDGFGTDSDDGEYGDNGYSSGNIH